MSVTFISPEFVDSARLKQASKWFDEARGQTHHGGGEDFDDKSWRTVPFTTKRDLRTELHPYRETGEWIARLSSSGTTAHPVVSPWSEADQRVADRTASEIHALCPPIDGSQCGVIAPSTSLAVAHFMCRQIEIAGGVPHLVAPGDPEAMCRTLVERGIEVVFSLPLVVSRLGEYFLATRGATPERIRMIFCGGDVLSPARQAMLAAMWGARVVDMFGCSELFGPVAGPAEDGRPLIWHCSDVAVEVVEPSTRVPCVVGERGVVVLTTLWPKASPLLRYWTDDIVEVTKVASQGRGFEFHYIGRPVSILAQGGRQLALREIDDELLGGGHCSSEWSITQSAEQIRIAAEAPRATGDATSELVTRLCETIGTPVVFAAKPPGSLPRTNPKFGVIRR